MPCGAEKPPILPPLASTRWQGMMIGTSLLAITVPTARAAFGEPARGEFAVADGLTKADRSRGENHFPLKHRAMLDPHEDVVERHPFSCGELFQLLPECRMPVGLGERLVGKVAMQTGPSLVGTAMSHHQPPHTTLLADKTEPTQRRRKYTGLKCHDCPLRKAFFDLIPEHP